MTREVVRRICGHAEAVYAVGPPGRIAKKIERSSGDLCRTCRDRLQTSAFEVVVSERSDDPSGDEAVRNVLERRRERS